MDERIEALTAGASALRFRASKLDHVLKFWHEGSDDPKAVEARERVITYRAQADILDTLEADIAALARLRAAGWEIADDGDPYEFGHGS